MELMACQNLAVPAEVMRHIVNVESSSNPYAIGVVGGQLVRQPQNLGEALATVHMLDAKGYNYSLGVAQVNRANLGKYGLDSYEKAFQLCPNLTAGSNILAACYRSSGGNWGKAFSCYYSGNFVTGYQDGYVQKVYDSINSAGTTNVEADATQPIPLQFQAFAYNNKARGMPLTAPTDASYRQAIRSVALDTAVASLVPSVKTAPSVVRTSDPAQVPSQPTPPGEAALQANSTVSPTAPAVASGAATTTTSDSVFVPQVRGPNDPPVVSIPTPAVAPVRMASTHAGSTPMAGDHADLRQENSDAAFVF
ncbi:MAG: transglycosylase SLT domain-containing protein [Rhodanobacter sp.]